MKVHMENMVCRIHRPNEFGCFLALNSVDDLKEKVCRGRISLEEYEWGIEQYYLWTMVAMEFLLRMCSREVLVNDV